MTERDPQKLLIPGVDTSYGKKDRLIVSESGTKSLLLPRLEVMTYPEAVGTELIRINPFVTAANLRPMLEQHHSNWRGELREVAREAQVKKITGGDVYTSMEYADKSTFYQPTKKEVIREELPWIHRLFEQEIRYLVERVTGDPTMHLGEDSSALNMNYTSEGPYELHFDRNPITALLGATDVQIGEGGELVLHEGRDPLTNRAYGRKFGLRPQAGIVYIFDGLKHPHEVTPYHGKQPRLVVPGDYYSYSVREVIDRGFNKKIGLNGRPLANSNI